MRLRIWLRNLRARINLQFIRISWLDIKRDKKKAIFGVLGIGISLFLLTAIGISTDSLNYRTVKDMNDITGSADIIIMQTFETDLTFDYAFDQDIMEKLEDIENVEDFFPRILMPVEFSSDNTDDNGTLELYGIDFEAEHENGRMGELIIVDEEGERTEKVYDDVPGEGECVILWNVAVLLNVSKGDKIDIRYNQWYKSYEVVEICEQDRKFMKFETAAVILDLEVCQDFFGRPREINHIIGKLVYPEDFYNAKNIDAVNIALRQIANDVQDRLDVNDYQVILPKLEVLEAAQTVLEFLSILFWIVAFFAMMISGILINSVLTTSVEDRVREFGILRVVGAKKSFLVKMVLFEGFLYGLLGTLLGMALAIFVGLPLIIGYINAINPDSPAVIYMIYPETIMTTLLIGSIVPLIIALIPAYKAGKKDLVKSLNPFLTDEEWEVHKEGSMSIKRVITGLSIASVGILIFVMLPQILVVGNFSLLAFIFIGLLEAILIGLVLASLGIVPLIQKVYIRSIRPWFKRYSHLIEMSLRRYRRRNTSTVIMFAISFSFIFFTTGINEMQKENTTYVINYLYGSDVVMVNQGYEENGDAVTLDTYEELEEFGEVRQCSYSLHNTIDIQAVTAIFMESQSEEPKFIEDMASNQITEMLQFYMDMWDRKYQVYASDISNHDSTYVSFLSVNEDFLDMVERDLIIWSSPGSNFEDSFPELFEENDTCIVAKSVANLLGINDVGEKIRATFFNPNIANHTGDIHLLEVVGISGGIPGFWNFRSADYFASMGGIMVSDENYVRLMNVTNPLRNDMIIDKIFINLYDDTVEDIKDTMELIQKKFNDYEFAIDDALSKIEMVEDLTEDANQLLELIFMFAVITSIVGLISAMYAIMLERKFEIGILRSMGMKSKEIRNMFIVESLIIMLSAGIIGTFIGAYCAYLLLSNIAVLLEIPLTFIIPGQTFVRVFGISIIAAVVGMAIILRKMTKKTVMEIFREAF